MDAPHEQSPVERSIPTTETGSFVRYRVPQNVAARQGDLIVKDDHGNAAFCIDGGPPELEDVVRMRSLDGGNACLIRGSALLAGGPVQIVDPNGMAIATVARAELSPVRDQFVVAVDTGTIWIVEGSVIAYEYRIGGLDGTIADISRRWFRARGFYGVQVSAGWDALLVLAVAVCLDLTISMRR